MSALGGIFLKIGASSCSIGNSYLVTTINIITNWKILLGLLLYFIPAAIWIYLLRTLDISFLQPIFSLTYAITPVLAYFLLEERFDSTRWIGISIIILGVVVISQSK